jgi:hypothetical protein
VVLGMEGDSHSGIFWDINHVVGRVVLDVSEDLCNFTLMKKEWKKKRMSTRVMQSSEPSSATSLNQFSATNTNNVILVILYWVVFLFRLRLFLISLYWFLLYFLLF